MCVFTLTFSNVSKVSQKFTHQTLTKWLMQSVIFAEQDFKFLHLFVFQEDEYEWGSSSILDALPSITSQQRRLALAAMRWRKTLQGRSEQRVYLQQHTHTATRTVLITVFRIVLSTT